MEKKVKVKAEIAEMKRAEAARLAACAPVVPLVDAAVIARKAESDAVLAVERVKYDLAVKAAAEAAIAEGFILIEKDLKAADSLAASSGVGLRSCAALYAAAIVRLFHIEPREGKRFDKEQEIRRGFVVAHTGWAFDDKFNPELSEHTAYLLQGVTAANKARLDNHLLEYKADLHPVKYKQLAADVWGLVVGGKAFKARKEAVHKRASEKFYEAIGKECAFLDLKYRKAQAQTEDAIKAREKRAGSAATVQALAVVAGVPAADPVKVFDGAALSAALPDPALPDGQVGVKHSIDDNPPVRTDSWGHARVDLVKRFITPMFEAGAAAATAGRFLPAYLEFESGFKAALQNSLASKK